MGVMRLGFVHLRVTDLEEARNHYSNTLGMTVVAEQPGKLHLKCWDEWDHHSLVLEEGGVGLVKLGYKCQTAEDLEKFERRSQQFGATTSRVSKGENLTVGDGVRILLPSEQTIELYTEMEFSGTETGSLNPEAWPRNMRGAGTNWIDHALMPAEDPALVERFFMECLDFRPAERAVTDPVPPGADRHLAVLRRVPARHRLHQGTQRQAAPLRVPPRRLERHPEGRRHLLDG